MKISTEVANAHHVEVALKYGMDMVWIGARSTANPFAVQEIAEQLFLTNFSLPIDFPGHLV